MHVQMQFMIPADIRRKLHDTNSCLTLNISEQSLSTVGVNKNKQFDPFPFVFMTQAGVFEVEESCVGTS